MRSQMKQIINGKMYNTETAEVIAHNEYWDGHNNERYGRNLHLYKTIKGNYFLGYSTLWQGEKDYIEAITKEAAKQYYEKLPEHEWSYELAFDVIPEEA